MRAGLLKGQAEEWRPGRGLAIHLARLDAGNRPQNQAEKQALDPELAKCGSVALQVPQML
jgi:hypothetical protein